MFVRVCRLGRCVCVCDYMTVCISPWEGRGGRRNPLLFSHLSPHLNRIWKLGFHEKAGRNLEAYLILLHTLSCYDLERWQQLQKYWSDHCPKPRPQHQPSVSPETPLTHVPKIQVIKRPGRGPRAPLWLPSSCAWQMLNVFTISLLSPNDLTPCREERENIENI